MLANGGQIELIVCLIYAQQSLVKIIVSNRNVNIAKIARLEI